LILDRPANAWALYVFAHGAGAGMRHPFMEAMAEALGQEGIATLRYEFPYMEARRRPIDPPSVLHARTREAVAAARAEGLPLLAGGKSMGGRMTSQAQALSPLPDVRGLVVLGFPLHPAKKPGTKRADHLREVQVPMLFLQGTRDQLCDLSLLEPIVRELPRATLHLLEGADHAFHALRKTGRTDAGTRTEMARTMAEWARAVVAGSI
jgi:predicted alpha/beta-hydrolase family hydrolase